MKKLLLIFLFLLPIFAFSQSQSSLLLKANQLLEEQKFSDALTIFKQLRSSSSKSDTVYKDIAYGYSATLHSLGENAKKEDDWNQLIELRKVLIKSLEEDKAYLRPGLQDFKYWAYKDIIVSYFGLNEHSKAKPYQDLLYTGYKNKTLPEGIDEYYNFEKLTINNQNIWGYEWFPSLGDKETEGSFSKHVYYIYSRNEDGSDKDQLYTLHTVKVHKLNKDSPDYVLTKRTYNNEQEVSETIWSATFNSPIDYKLLHNAIMDYVYGKLKSDTKSTISK